MTNYYIACHETSDTTSDSESAPKNGQVQLWAHARAAFASEPIGSITYPFAMLSNIELAEAIKSTR
jgi:hypothetical protein